MAYDPVTNIITRLYRFGTAADATNGDLITQVQHDVALDEVITDVNALAAEVVSRLGLIVIDTFTGDNTTTSFPLTSSPTSEDNLFVHIDGIYQNKSAFSLSGSNLVFSSPPPLDAVIEALAMPNANGASVINTFAAADTTPTVAAGSVFRTDTGTLTITSFDNGSQGKEITVISKGAVTFDTTGTNLAGSSADLVTASGDTTRWVCDDGTIWRLLGFVKASADNSAGA